MFAHAEAEGQYRTALELARELEDAAAEAEALEKLGAVLSRVARFTEAEEMLEGARRLYRMEGNQEGETWAVGRLGMLNWRRTTYSPGIVLLRAFLDGLEETGNRAPSPGVARVWVELASLRNNQLEPDAAGALAAAERASELTRAVGDQGLVAAAGMQQGLSLNHLGRWDEARAVLRQTIELAEAIGELDVLMRSLNILGFVDVELGDTSTVRPYHKRALEIAKTLGDPERIAFYGSNLGTISFASGDSAQAKEDLDRTVATVKQLGAAEQTALPLMWLGWVCVVQGKADQGLRDLEEAEAVGQNPSVKAYVAAVRALHALGEGQHGSAVRLLEPVVDASSDGWWGVLIFALPLLAEAYLAKGDSDRTERLVERALALAQQIGTGRARADALLVRGKLATERGAWTEAAEDIEEALALMQLWPWSFSRARLLYEYGVMLTRQGEPAVARPKLEQALTIFRRLEARPDVERTEQALAALS